MIALRRFAFCWLLCCSACSLDPAASGETCTRSSQCKAGLGCVYPADDGNAKEGRCSADLSSLYDPSQVPMLMPDARVEAADSGAMDAGMSSAPIEADTGTMPTDMPVDAGTGAMPMGAPGDAG